MTNLAQIAATSKGNGKLQSLIGNRKAKYRMKSIFWRNNPCSRKFVTCGGKE
ncbi:hypothetical protein Q4Q34_15440 [Flavivirga abyssicola]|uniref:hypothetical protein n=1 Tax=Flavivirga abyssicola TaxID=3063533 RepID=UPI0026E0530C|nr:hypothetical protein [Flavivirga sp. MEBiC07777]WVK12610.1 hypothetical protein Q4Q34_15440 [Flavivirga sp. MEBiC07777]